MTGPDGDPGPPRFGGRWYTVGRVRGMRLPLLACVAALALPAPALADHAGPLGVQYHLDSSFDVPGPGGGNQATADSSGHGLDAGRAGPIAVGTDGRFGNHLLSSHTGVIQPGVNSIFEPQRLTLIAWVRRAAGAAPDLKYVAGRGDDGPGTCLGSSYALYTGFQLGGGLVFYVRRAGDAQGVTSPSAGPAIWNGQWRMVAGVFDGSRVRMYLDGAQIGSGNTGASGINYSLGGGNTFYFDGYPQTTCGNADFDGGIDEVRLYRRALSPTEIARLAAHAGPDPPVLVPDASPSGTSGPTPTTVAELPPPVLGRRFNVQPLSGDVFVSVPTQTARASQKSVPGLKGRRFVPLEQARQVPIGSFLDTRRGRVRIASARDAKGVTQSGAFSASVFQVLQSRRRSARGLTDLAMKGASFSRCRSRRSKGAQASARRKLSSRTVRRLRADARGRFRTRGRYSAATVRGTVWTTADRCNGTLTKVSRGKVAVRDFRRRKTIVLKAGKSYLARPRR